MTYTDEVTTVEIDYGVEPDSSFIEFVGYNADLSTAVVVIHGTTYEYSGVSYADYVALVNAESVGHRYTKNFRAEFGPATPIYGQVEFVFRSPTVEYRNNDEFSDEELNMTLAAIFGKESEKPRDNENVEAAMATVDPVVEATWQRREALTLAVEVHKNTYQPDSLILETAEAFKRYLNG